MNKLKSHRHLGIVALSGVLTLTALATGGRADDATLMPNAIQYFMDANGKPLSNGKVFMYTPSTTTAKTTWTTAGKTVPQANPIPLGISGKPANPIYGDGSYRQLVKDQFNNTIWDFNTASTGSGGGVTPTPTIGDGDLVGTIKPWAGFQAPAQYVFSYGQAISRTTYSDLFTALTQAQTVVCTIGSSTITGVPDNTQVSVTPGSKVEASCVPPGTTVLGRGSGTLLLSANATVSTATSARFFFYGNGDGSTTFNLPDLRGRVIAGRDNMGSSTIVGSGRLDENFFAQAALGAAAGAQSFVLAPSNLPAYTPTGTIAVTNGAITSSSNTGGTIAGSAITTPGGGTLASSGQTITSTQAASSATFTGAAQGGTSSPHAMVQPTIETNYIIKITPDTSSLVATGVASIQGMTGVLLCGANMTCTGNIINATAASPSSILFTQTGTGAVPETLDTMLRNMVWTPEMFNGSCSPYLTSSASVPDSTTALTNALAAADAFGGTLQLGPCVYKFTTGLRIQNFGTSIKGSSENNSTLLFEPTVDGTALTIQKSTPTDVFWNTISNLRIASTDTTHVKKGINLIDVSNVRINQVNITAYPSGYWSGGGASRGLAINGHDVSEVKNINIYADFPLTIGINPDQSISMDSFVFENLTLVSSATGNPPITIETGVCLYNTIFQGAQNWIGGGDKLRWIDTTSTCRSQGLYISGIKSEQSVSAAGYSIHIEHNSGLLAFRMSDATLGDTNGIKLRNVVNPIIENIDMQIPTTLGLTGIDVDTTAGTLQLNNSSWHSSVIGSFGGLTNCQSSASLAANSATIPPRGFFATTCLESFSTLALTGNAINRLLLGQGANAISSLAAGTSTQVLHGGTPPTFSAVANADLVNPSTTVNGQVCTLGSTCTVTASAASIAVGTTTITGGTTGRVLYDNAGVLGELVSASANTASAIVARDGSGNFSAGTISAALSGNATTATSATSATTATTATTATNTTITDDTTTNATMYPTWVTANTGNLPQKVSSTKMSFNPSTGTLSTTNLSASANVAAVTFNNVGLAALGSTASIIMGSGKTFTASNSLTLAGTDSTTMTFPTTTATIARTDAGQTFTGAQVFASTATANTSISSPIHTASGALTFQSNGSTFAGSINTGQQWTIGSNNTAPTGPLLVVNKNTSAVNQATVNGSVSANVAAHLVGVDGSAVNLAIDAYGNGGAPSILTRRAQGTQAAPTAVLSGDSLFSFTTQGYFGSGAYAAANWSNFGGLLVSTATENWSAGAQGSAWDFYATATGGTTFAQRARIGAGLMVGNTTDPGAGGIRATGATIQFTALANTATTSAVCYNTGTGLLTYNSTVGTCTVSDERLKDFTGPITGALGKLLQIRGMYYNWKDPQYGTGRQIGVGAQTVESVFPELVSTDATGTKSADYQRLVVPIIEAIRELKADNDDLRAELLALKTSRAR